MPEPMPRHAHHHMTFGSFNVSSGIFITAMFLTHILQVALVLAPTMASAAIFPAGTVVKSLDAIGFKKAMKESRTSLVAFVAPWCGHCQRMAPEYSKAAKNLNPLVPFYAVDCDENKSLCTEHGVEGFPTVKLFSRGGKKKPVLYTGERTASAFVDYVSRRIPHKIEKLSKLENILTWVNDEVDQHRVLLLTKEKRIPVSWKVLDSKYDKLKFGIHRDGNGVTAARLGVTEADARSKILVYPVGSRTPARYEGATKHDALSQFLDSVLDGTAKFNFLDHSAETEETETPNIIVGQTGSNEEPAIPVDGKQTSFSDLVDAIHDIPQYETHVVDFEGQGTEHLQTRDTESIKSEGNVIAETASPEPQATEAPTPEPVPAAEKEPDQVAPQTVIESASTEASTDSESIVADFSSENKGEEQIPSETVMESALSASSATSIVSSPSETAETKSHVQEDVISETAQDTTPTSSATSAQPESLTASPASGSDETTSETKGEVERPTDEL